MKALQSFRQGFLWGFLQGLLRFLWLYVVWAPCKTGCPEDIMISKRGSQLCLVEVQARSKLSKPLVLFAFLQHLRTAKPKKTQTSAFHFYWSGDGLKLQLFHDQPVWLLWHPMFTQAWLLHAGHENTSAVQPFFTMQTCCFTQQCSHHQAEEFPIRSWTTVPGVGQQTELLSICSCLESSRASLVGCGQEHRTSHALLVLF